MAFFLLPRGNAQFESPVAEPGARNPGPAHGHPARLFGPLLLTGRAAGGREPLPGAVLPPDLPLCAGNLLLVASHPSLPALVLREVPCSGTQSWASPHVVDILHALVL